MAFVVKNFSRFDGSAKINSEWKTLKPGETLVVNKLPESHSHNVKVILVPDEAPKQTPKASAPAPATPAAAKENAGGEKVNG